MNFLRHRDPSREFIEGVATYGVRWEEPTLRWKMIRKDLTKFHKILQRLSQFSLLFCESFSTFDKFSDTSENFKEQKNKNKK